MRPALGPKLRECVNLWGALVGKQAAALLCVLIGIIFWTSASAEIYLGAQDDIFINVVLTGDITQRDVAFFRSSSKTFETKQLMLWLNSPGGDLLAAMEIGRIIRSVDGWTYIGDKERCYSSCALIFIAGVNRTNYGELGLHRPYFASAPLSREQIEKQVPLMRSAVKKYVEEMGITDSFFERMFNTEPSDIEIFRLDEAEKIVPLRDPVYDEIETATMARTYGLTTSEYRKRVSLALRSCSDRRDCLDEIMWGLSVEDFRSRWAKVDAACGHWSDSEKEIISTTPMKDRQALPFVAKFYACRVNTMQGK
jgi:hypothetical protein